MNILITGATGSIGYDLVRYLSKKNKIYAYYRTKSNKVRKIKNVNWIKTKSLSNCKFSSKLKPKCIIHCAVDQKYLNLNKNKYLRSNTKIVKNLINHLKKFKNNSIFINFSSIEVYGIIKNKKLNEHYRPIKQNTYGYMKYICEKILQNSGINYINLRLPGVLSKYSKKIKHRPWINFISHKFLKNEQVCIYNALNKFNNLISTLELTNIISKILTKKDNIKDDFNLGCSKPLSLRAIIKIIKKITHSKSVVIEQKTSKSSFFISTKKIEKFLNYKIDSTKNIITKHIYNLTSVKI